MEAATRLDRRPLVMIAGVCGRTEQAVREARIAVGLGYHAGLLSLAALKGAGADEILDHCRAVAEEIPLVGFYLQPAVGGIHLDAEFWRRFCAIDNVVAIKVAPFNRYRTLDVVRGVVAARAEERIALYTGNDDHIVLDLVTPFTVDARRRAGDGALPRRAARPLVGVDAGRRRAARAAASGGGAAAPSPAEHRWRSTSRVTDCNAAFFDVANDFHGCIAGCHEVLRRQGLLEGIWCLDPNEGLSPGQTRGDRPRVPRPRRSLRRRLRRRQPRALAVLSRLSRAPARRSHRCGGPRERSLPARAPCG